MLCHTKIVSETQDKRGRSLCMCMYVSVCICVYVWVWCMCEYGLYTNRQVCLPKYAWRPKEDTTRLSCSVLIPLRQKRGWWPEPLGLSIPIPYSTGVTCILVATSDLWEVLTSRCRLHICTAIPLTNWAPSGAQTQTFQFLPYSTYILTIVFNNTSLLLWAFTYFKRKSSFKVYYWQRYSKESLLTFICSTDVPCANPSCCDHQSLLYCPRSCSWEFSSSHNAQYPLYLLSSTCGCILLLLSFP